MRKGLIIVGGLIVLAAGGVSALWYAGQPEARSRFESALQVAAAQGGFEAEFSDVAMGGFPLAYEAQFQALSMRNPESRVEIEMPEMAARVSPTNPNTVRLLFPEEFTVTDNSGEAPTGLKVFSSALVADVTDTGDERGAIAVSAERFAIEPVSTEGMPELDALSIAYVNPRISGDFTQRTLENGGDLRFNLTAEALELEAEATGFEQRSLTLGTGAIDSDILVDQEVARVETSYADLTMRSIDSSGALLEVASGSARVNAVYSGADASQMALFRAAIGQLLNGEDPNALSQISLDGDAAIDVTVALEALAASVTGLSEGGGQTVRWKTDAAGYDLRLQGGQASFNAGTKAFGLEFVGPLTRAGGVDNMEVSAVYPFRPAADVQDASIRYALTGVTMDDTTWAELNTSGELDRQIGGLELDLGVGVVIPRDPFLASFDAEPPFDVKTVSINSLTLDMLGFSGAATGEIAIENDVPNGAVRILLRNWRKLMNGLGSSALFPELAPMVGMATITLESLVVPGESEEESVLDIEFVGQQVVVNGRPLGEPQ